MSQGWIGVDLDGTLAKYDGWKGTEHIGEPVPLMVNRVKMWLDNDIEVRIITARAFNAKVETFTAIKKWCKEHLGQELEINCFKDYGMIQLWDDRAVQVVPNTGVAVQDLLVDARDELRKLEKKCKCENVQCGTYENYVTLNVPDNIILRMNNPERTIRKQVCLDSCIQNEIKYLWSLGIVTTGCCCGHNTSVGFVNVDKSHYQQMIDLGYEVYYDHPELNRKDTFVIKHNKD